MRVLRCRLTDIMESTQTRATLSQGRKIIAIKFYRRWRTNKMLL